MPRLFLIADRSEIERRRKLLGAGEVVEVWEALHTPDVTWLGDPELRRIAYQRGAAWDPPEEGTDLAALGIKYVSVTPLRLDLTHDAMMARMIDAIGKD